jgi:lysophospholipase L1-like esterase
VRFFAAKTIPAPAPGPFRVDSGLLAVDSRSFAVDGEPFPVDGQPLAGDGAPFRGDGERFAVTGQLPAVAGEQSAVADQPSARGRRMRLFSGGNPRYGDGMKRLLLLALLGLGGVVHGQTNTAVIPVPKLENDSYDWAARHAEVLRIQRNLDPEIVLIGDSITHFWGGEPKANHVNGAPAWQSVFGKYRTLNLGFGWDRTQNVLWRLDHGEFDGLHPRVVIVHIGTNNTSETAHARQNTPAEIAAGVQAICERIRQQAPGAKIVLMNIFPREQSPEHPRRKLIAKTNRRLAQIPGVIHLDIGAKLLQPDGTLTRDVMGDFCHPTNKGYQVWADALAPVIAAAMAK